MVRAAGQAADEVLATQPDGYQPTDVLFGSQRGPTQDSKVRGGGNKQKLHSGHLSGYAQRNVQACES